MDDLRATAAMFLLVVLHSTISITSTRSFMYQSGQIPCHEVHDCPGPLFDCKDQMCVCGRPLCDMPKSPGERCSQDSDCFSTELVCYGKGDLKACRCRNRMYTYDMKFNRCVKDESYVYDPVQNFIIPAIIVMSVGAMVYLGVKLFCNCGKMWRRRQSQLSRELETITGVPHQQPTWIASYRVFSQISNASQHTLHPAPCMGLFVPNLSPPSYEEAMKHKVILSSSPGTGLVVAQNPPQLPQLPVYPFEPPPFLEQEPPISANPRIATTTGRDQTTLRYYPGEECQQIPVMWNSGRELIHEAQQDDRDERVGEQAREREREREPRSVRTMPRPRRYLRPLANQPP